MPRRLPDPAVVAFAAATLVTACDQRPVDSIAWEEGKRVSGVIAPGATLVIGEGGAPALTIAWQPLRWPDDSTTCAGTTVAARARGDTVYAAWWRRNQYGHGDLMLSRSENGRSWGPPTLMGGAVPSDQICMRPPPGLAADPATGAVFLAWHGMTNFGPGMIFAEAPTAGRKPWAIRIDSIASIRMASLAAQGDTVAVAWEVPSAVGSSVRLAISLSAGHIPVTRGTVSAEETRAFAPVVAVRGGRVAVAWNEGRRGEAPPSAAARVGRILRLSND